MIALKVSVKAMNLPFELVVHRGQGNDLALFTHHMFSTREIIIVGICMKSIMICQIISILSKIFFFPVFSGIVTPRIGGKSRIQDKYKFPSGSKTASGNTILKRN